MISENVSKKTRKKINKQNGNDEDKNKNANGQKMRGQKLDTIFQTPNIECIYCSA